MKKASAMTHVMTIECEDCDHEEEGGEEGGPVVVSLKPQGYNPVAGDKKEILNALMNRYKSL